MGIWLTISNWMRLKRADISSWWPFLIFSFYNRNNIVMEIQHTIIAIILIIILLLYLICSYYCIGVPYNNDDGLMNGMVCPYFQAFSVLNDSATVSADERSAWLAHQLLSQLLRLSINALVELFIPTYVKARGVTRAKRCPSSFFTPYAWQWQHNQLATPTPHQLQRTAKQLQRIAKQQVRLPHLLQLHVPIRDNGPVRASFSGAGISPQPADL